MAIKTFLRVDEDMVKQLSSKIIVAYTEKGHWGVWLFPEYEMVRDESFMSWLNNQPKDCYSYFHFNGGEVVSADAPIEGKVRYIGLGVSYSTTQPKEIEALLNLNAPIRMIKTFRTVSTWTPTKNPHLFNDGAGYLMYVPPADVSVEVPDSLEKKFIDSLKGHDFFYGYSDSLSVYQNGEADEKRLKVEGVRSGLSVADVVRLYNAEYRRLSKRV